ncbi:MAG: collagen-like protein [Deltaproteobacteria bacterium]|nr:collagen-like protein [Deltaproteobacteria bacterium]
MKPIAAFGITFGSVVLAILAAAACSGADGRTGPAGPAGSNGSNGINGDPGPTGEAGVSPTLTASISLVEPNHATVGRTVELSISGDNTTWDDSTKVQLSDSAGDGGIDTGIVVTPTVHSATAITASITVPAEAVIGPRDLYITTGDAQPLVYKGFDIQSALKVTVTGDLAQGSLVKVIAENTDKTTPFDVASTTVSASGLDLTDHVVGSSAIRFTALINPLLDLDAGAPQIVINSNGLLYKDTSSLQITPRTAEELQGQPAASKDVVRDMQSFLFSQTPPSNNIGLVALKLTAEPDGGVAAPEVSFVPLPGSATVLEGIQSTVVAKSTSDPMILGFASSSAEPYKFIVYNSAVLGGAAGFKLEVSASSTTVSSSTKSGTNDTKTSAEPVDLATPVQYVGATFSSNGEDWYTFVVPPNNDKALHVGTFASSPSELGTDTMVELYFDTGTVPVQKREQASCFNQIRVPNAGAGTYYLHVASVLPDGGAAGGLYSVFFMLK